MKNFKEYLLVDLIYILLFIISGSPTIDLSNLMNNGPFTLIHCSWMNYLCQSMTALQMIYNGIDYLKKYIDQKNKK